MLTTNPSRKMAVQGHTDDRGSSEYNLALGQRRAEAVVKSLTLLGVEADPGRGGELRQGASGGAGRERGSVGQEPPRRADGRPVRATLALLRGAGAAALAACAFAVALPAQAGIFDDDEARRAILDLRKQLEQSNEQARARQAEQMAVMNDSIDQLKRSLLDLNSQIETQRADNAKLRGQIEELDAQRRRAAAEADRHPAGRRRPHPQDRAAEGHGRRPRVHASTRRRSASTTTPWPAFAAASSTAPPSGFAALLKRFPATGYRDSALFWLGNAQYALRQYKEAIASFRSPRRRARRRARARPRRCSPIANCQAELKDTSRGAARRSTSCSRPIRSRRPRRPGKERLASLK